MNGQHRVEEVGEPDALGLGHQPEERSVAIEAPGPANLDHLQAGLVVPVQDLVGDATGGILVGEFEGVRAEPLHVHDRDEAVGRYASDAG